MDWQRLFGEEIDEAKAYTLLILREDYPEEFITQFNKDEIKGLRIKFMSGCILSKLTIGESFGIIPGTRPQK